VWVGKVPSEMFVIGESGFLDAKMNGVPGGYCDMFGGGIR